MNEMDNVAYAVFWHRFLATLIDAVLLFALGFILTLPLNPGPDHLTGSSRPVHQAGTSTFKLGFSPPAHFTFRVIRKETIHRGPPFNIVWQHIVPTVHIVAELIVNWCFYPFLIIACWRSTQTTPGKWITGLRLIDSDTGGKPSPRQCLVRYLGYLPVPLLPLHFLVVAFHPRKQGVHDLLARTMVVKSKPAAV